MNCTSWKNELFLERQHTSFTISGEKAPPPSRLPGAGEGEGASYFTGRCFRQRGYPLLKTFRGKIRPFYFLFFNLFYIKIPELDKLEK